MRLVLGHGASGTAASMQPYVDGLRRRGVEALAIDLPRGRAERAAVRFAPYQGEAIGGHSFGGRSASLAAAEGGYAALVCFSFPVSARAAERTAHFPRIPCPVLVLNGTADPLAPVDDVRRAVARLAHARLVLYEGARHGLAGRLEEALDEAAAFLHSVGG